MRLLNHQGYGDNMYKLAIVFCFAIISMTLSGCFGGLVLYTGECESEIPSTSARDLEYKPGLSPAPSSKGKFLKEWGKPDSVEVTSENKEIWVYKKHLWCGIIPCFVLCAPLVLPLCSGTDQIYFEGNEANRLHIKRTILNGFVIPGGTGPTDRACRYPTPIPLSKKIPPDKTVYLSVTFDQQKHKSDKDYLDAEILIRNRLPSELISRNIVKAVVVTPEAADYDMTVTILHAYISNSYWGRIGAHHFKLKIRIDDKSTKQTIGEFDISVNSDSNSISKESAVDSAIEKAMYQITGAIR